MSDALALFEEQRPDLNRLAYRILGTRTDADDILQDAYLRWSRTEVSAVKSPKAFLTTVVTRLCIDRRREIDQRKETYIGQWLPEPRVQPYAAADRVSEVAENVSMALLYVMERLSPAERAAYVLRQIFDYDYETIAEILEKSAASCRQLVSRAEQHVLQGRPRFAAASDAVARISGEFLQACASGDLDGLLRLLTDDVFVVSDGGGKAKAALAIIAGSDHVSRFFLGLVRKWPEHAQAEMVLVNGEPGWAVTLDDQVVTVFAPEFEGDRIRGFYIIRNPDKLPRDVY